MVSVNDRGLAQRVHDLMMEYDYSFMKHIDRGQCHAMAVPRAVVQLKAKVMRKRQQHSRRPLSVRSG